jgi:iron complex transport system substrate-binding protein
MDTASSKHPKYDQADAICAHVLEAKDRVLNFFGVGLLESLYRKTLAHALRNMGHKVEEEKRINVVFEGKTFDDILLRPDLVIDDCLVVELKSLSTAITIDHIKQTLSYMKLLDAPLGLILNFGACNPKEKRFRRVILAGANG